MFSIQVPSKVSQKGQYSRIRYNLPFSCVAETRCQVSYLRKCMKTPKVSRFKLHEDFAAKGWKTTDQFQKISDNCEYDITSSPTKYETTSAKQNDQEKELKRKPRLIEISNIESVFKENKLNSLNEVVRKPSENIRCFVQTLHDTPRHSQNCNPKKKSLELFIPDLHTTFQVKQVGKLNCIKKFRNLSNDPVKRCFRRKNSSDEKLKPQSKDEYSYKPTEILCTSLQSLEKDKIETFSLTSLDNHRERFEERSLKQGLQAQCQGVKNRCDGFMGVSDNTISLICDSNPIKRGSNKEQDFLRSSNKCINISKGFLNDFSQRKVINEDHDVYIENECSPTTVTSQEKVSVAQPTFKTKESSHSSTKISHRKRLISEAFNLQDLRESFQVNKKHCHKSLKSFDIPVTFQTDDSPTKSSSSKSVCLSNLNKFKNLSEVFTSCNSASAEGPIKNSDSDVLIEDKKSPIKPTKSSFWSVPCLEDDDSAMNPLPDSTNNEFSSEGKSIVCDNKVFMKTLQSSFQEKSASTDKGSNWVQSINWDDHPQVSNFECNEKVGKKSLKNILPGGFAEQMLKLQRRERSERVIWNHKRNELTKKAAIKSITFTLESVLHTGQFLLAKCESDRKIENLKDVLCRGNLERNFYFEPLDQGVMLDDSTSDNTLKNSKSEVFVLFKKNAFCKLQLKIGNVFALYPPWQVLTVPTLPLPVLLCTYFINPVDEAVESAQIEIPLVPTNTVSYDISHIKRCECEGADFSSTLFDSLESYGKSVCISARVQRIWETGIVCNRVQDILNAKDFLSFVILLQTKDSMILELKMYSAELIELYKEFLSDAEGRCFKFCNVIMSHRYSLNKFSKFFQIIKFIQTQTGKHKESSESLKFCYQFIPNNKILPCEISDEDFPLYYNYEFKPLSFLQKMDFSSTRFSCIGKIMFQDEKDFYVSDESLLHSKLRKYYKLKCFNQTKKRNQLVVGATVLLKETIVDKDCLIVDQFSKCEVLSNAESCKLMPSYHSRLKKISLITFEHVLSSLTVSSKPKDIVFVEGTISQVDESTAISWLECSYCFKENLLEDSNSVIYCEDCSCVVIKPVLKVKMEVTIFSPLNSSKVKIRLLSSTIKRILRICEDNYQPECNISDVLERSTGVLCCYVKSVDVQNKLKFFHLTEISH